MKSFLGAAASRWGAVASLALLAATAARGQAITPFSTQFENDPSVDQWSLVLDAGDLTSGLTTVDSHSPSHSLLLQGTSAFRTNQSMAAPDGQTYTEISFYSKGAAPTSQNVYYGQPSNTWVLNQYCLRVPPGFVTSIRSANGLPVYIDDVTVNPVTKAQVAVWADNLYATMPAQVNMPLTPTRQAPISNTMNLLKTGKTVNVVMLGDSIVNDTSGSPWDALLERAYPGCTINITTSVIGGTGAGFYKLPGNVQKYVLDYNPDLVIIGGISNDSAASVLSVMQQIRAGSSADIAVMDTAAGDSRTYPLTTDWSAPIDPTGTDYRSQLFAAAQQEDAAFIDMSAAWGRYLQDLNTLGVPETYLKRDALHDNQYGQEVLARSLESFFSPAGVAAPEPASMVLLGLGAMALLRRRRQN